MASAATSAHERPIRAIEAGFTRCLCWYGDLRPGRPLRLAVGPCRSGSESAAILARERRIVQKSPPAFVRISEHIGTMLYAFSARCATPVRAAVRRARPAIPRGSRSQQGFTARATAAKTGSTPRCDRRRSSTPRRRPTRDCAPGQAASLLPRGVRATGAPTVSCRDRESPPARRRPGSTRPRTPGRHGERRASARRRRVTQQRRSEWRGERSIETSEARWTREVAARVRGFGRRATNTSAAARSDEGAPLLDDQRRHDRQDDTCDVHRRPIRSGSCVAVGRTTIPPGNAESDLVSTQSCHLVFVSNDAKLRVTAFGFRIVSGGRATSSNPQRIARPNPFCSPVPGP